MLLKIGQRPDHGFDRPLGLLSDCHRRIEHFLLVLVTIANDRRGGLLTDSQRAQLGAAIAYFAVAAPKHTADEEDSLFPRLSASNDAAATRALQIVERLAHEHEAADERHQAVDSLVRRWLADGSLGHADADQLCRHLAALQRLYESHIATEDGILFPLALRLLSEEQVRDIGREMAARRVEATRGQRNLPGISL